MRVALYLQDMHPIRDGMDYVRYAEERGFEAVWQAESRLVREATVPMAAYAAVTSRIKVGSGVIPIWTRNVGLLAATFSTLDELAPGRVILGLGAWWEPLAAKVGVDRRKPLLAMREVVEATRRLLAMERVTYHGEFVNLDDVEIDIVHGDRSPKQVPIYIGATGMRMMELAGEIADGVVLNYMVGPDYNKRALDALATGAEKAGRSFEDIDRPQLVVCSVDRDRAVALDRSRELLTQYLGQQPHIMKASGVDPTLIEEIGKILTWPAGPEEIRKAMRLVPDDAVQMITASGNARGVPREGCGVRRERRDVPDPLPARRRRASHDRHVRGLAMRSFLGRDILSLKDMERDEFLQIFAVADELRPYAEKRHNTDLLASKTLLTAFYQPSTRTRLATEAAMHRLGGHVLGFSDAKMTRAGDFYQETIKDTVHMLEYYGDVIAMRHHQQGAPHEAAKWASVPVINCGDGWGEHPTQVLTDLYTIWKDKGTLDGLRVLCVGDMRMRTMHSILYAMSQFDMEAMVVSPPEMSLLDEFKAELDERNVSLPRVRGRRQVHRGRRRHLHGARRAGRLHAGPRRPHRRHGRRPRRRTRSRGSCWQAKAKRDAIILHSLPRMDELPPDVDGTRHARYWVEAFNGVVAAHGAARARPRRDRVGGCRCRHTCAAGTSSTSRSGRRTNSTPCSMSRSS